MQRRFQKEKRPGKDCMVGSEWFHYGYSDRRINNSAYVSIRAQEYYSLLYRVSDFKSAEILSK